MAKDLFHDAVRAALEKDGWTITDDPYLVKALASDYEIDLGAEKIIAAEKDAEKIAVEVKSFLRPSFAYEFHSVLGQYLNYAALMALQEPDRKLYLAVAEEIFELYFSQSATEYVVNLYRVKILIYNPITRLIVQWSER
jgi:hypothetical protein